MARPLRPGAHARQRRCAKWPAARAREREQLLVMVREAEEERAQVAADAKTVASALSGIEVNHAEDSPTPDPTTVESGVDTCFA